MSEQTQQPGRVAVIGLGIAGVATIKNLLETGFDVVGFDKTEGIGGIWRWSEDPNQTTITKYTVTNISKQSNCFQDFPFPADIPDYPTGAQMESYLKAYADKFHLWEHFRFGTLIEKVARAADDSHWTILWQDKDGTQHCESYARVVVTNGADRLPYLPKLDGAEHFRGDLLHSQNFKNIEDFKNKRVVVVGLGNTGGDTAVAISEVAAKTWISHRAGAIIVSRGQSGKPLDHQVSRRMVSIGNTISTLFPNISGKVANYAAGRMMLSKHKIDKDWNLLPAPPVANAAAVCNDYILDYLAKGTITSMPGIRKFLNPKDDTSSSSVEFTDGQVIDGVDVVILCTGYRTDYSILDSEADPTAFSTPGWDAAEHSNGLKFPRLYQGMFSTKHPQTLAFIGPYKGHSFAAFSNTDLSSQAIAQVWAGNYLLPSKHDMDEWCDANYRDCQELIKRWRVSKVGSNPKLLEHWLNEAAGNQLNEKLGWGIEGWRFWWQEYRLYKLIMDGVNTPYVYRLFDCSYGGRKRWTGATEAIYIANGKKLP